MPPNDALAVMCCTLCGSPAYFSVKEQVWRHAGEPHEMVYAAQSFCDKYGYPIQVRPIPERKPDAA
jgi:hypothetical protein